MNTAILPVAVIGAGPVGLAAAAHLTQRGLPFVLLEAGSQVGASIMQWGHVKLFSPWRYVVDSAARALLEPTGWRSPDPERDPLGAELVRDYLQRLAALPAIAQNLRLNTRVLSVARRGMDKLKRRDHAHAHAPFVLMLETQQGEVQLLASAVIDASGTYEHPNPLGANGLFALGERGSREHIAYGIPDALGRDRARYAGKHVLVVGSGHSAFNTILALEQLTREAPATRVTWAVRRAQTGQMFGGLADDQLSQRGALGARAEQVLARGAVTLVTGLRIERVERDQAQIHVYGDDGRALGPFDEVIACTGFRPDLALLGELQLALDAQVESPVALAPLIDPNVHSCGSVPPHGYEELKHPESDVYVVGMKSYGRAPTFLMLTGYEQVRSVVAALAGDMVAARDVQLVLPETGVCGGGGSDCCAAPAGNVISLDSLLAPLGATAGTLTPLGATAGTLTPLGATAGTLTPLGALVAAGNVCCSIEKLAVCCEPGDKAACCGTSSDGCGCQ